MVGDWGYAERPKGLNPERPTKDPQQSQKLDFSDNKQTAIFSPNYSLFGTASTRVKFCLRSLLEQPFPMPVLAVSPYKHPSFQELLLKAESNNQMLGKLRGAMDRHSPTFLGELRCHWATRVPLVPALAG
jgi:hypothetical protein